LKTLVQAAASARAAGALKLAALWDHSGEKEEKKGRAAG
jgi:hypothetical protein